jgi:hypothetical protein
MKTGPRQEKPIQAAAAVVVVEEEVEEEEVVVAELARRDLG